LSSSLPCQLRGRSLRPKGGRSKAMTRALSPAASSSAGMTPCLHSQGTVGCSAQSRVHVSMYCSVDRLYPYQLNTLPLKPWISSTAVLAVADPTCSKTAVCIFRDWDGKHKSIINTDYQAADIQVVVYRQAHCGAEGSPRLLVVEVNIAHADPLRVWVPQRLRRHCILQRLWSPSQPWPYQFSNLGRCTFSLAGTYAASKTCCTPAPQSAHLYLS